MKSKLLSASFFGGILLFVCCGSPPGEQGQSQDTGVPDHSLCVVDSFGVEFGDSLRMIGSIDDFCTHPDGSVLILDRASMCVRVIPRMGEPYLISREGEGPGELLFPMSMCAMQDGTILVADPMKLAVMEFTPEGVYEGDLFTTDRYVPNRMFQVDSASITGSMMHLEMGDQVFFSFYIGRFDGDSLPSVKYMTMSWEWPAPELYSEIEGIDFTAGAEGRVFIAPDNTSYLVSVFDPMGEELFRIENTDLERLEKTPEEIEDEIEYFESWASEDQAYTGGYEPPPYRRLISLAGVDPQGNLWIERLDAEAGHSFDVWDDTGDLLFTASLSGFDDIDLSFSVDRHGILAAVVDSEHYPRVFRLEMETGGDNAEE